MGRKMTTETFIERANIVHNGVYDYSKSEFVKSNIKIIIICRVHEEFSQTPNNHLYGYGCKKCAMTNLANKRKSTTEIFIEKSINTHGDRYNYSKSIYIGSENKLIIICKIHGEFPQAPYNHIKGCGCPKCGDINSKEKQLFTQQMFMDKAIETHGDTYDYSQSKYKGAHIKINIICKEHGIFPQTPNSHFRGAGCPKCGDITTANSKKSNTEEFIINAINKHGDIYDYSQSLYINDKTKVIIICREHGIFLQDPSGHLQGHGCKKCAIIYIANKRRLTTEIFIEKSINICGNRYDYSQSIYVSSQEPLTIICREHGAFLQSPSNHWVGKNCSKCSKVYQYTTEEWINKAIDIHGNKYDYSLVKYNGCYINVDIVCKECNKSFKQTPLGHLKSFGCKKCSKIKKYSKVQIIWLDFLQSYYNINIQHAENDKELAIPDSRYRADGYCEETNTIYEFHGDYWHGNPKLFKPNIMNKVSKKTFGELYENTTKKEQFIRDSGYNLVVIWELQWTAFIKFVIQTQRKYKK